MARRTPVLIAAAALLVVLAALCISPRQHPAGRPAGGPNTLPDKISDADFWRLVETMSEPNGYFRSDNLLSNEDTFQYVIPALERRVASGGVELGVGDGQEFSYIRCRH